MKYKMIIAAATMAFSVNLLAAEPYTPSVSEMKGDATVLLSLARDCQFDVKVHKSDKRGYCEKMRKVFKGTAASIPKGHLESLAAEAEAQNGTAQLEYLESMSKLLKATSETKTAFKLMKAYF